MDPDDILIVREPVRAEDLKRLVQLFGDMVKFVADIERGVLSLGGDLHADGEALLVQGGSRPADLWGGNYYPGLGPAECIRYTSLINIRPRQDNLGMEVKDPAVRARIEALVFRLVGKGEALR